MLNGVLWTMYREGPGYLGGWLGLSDQELCARLTPGSQVMDWVHRAGLQFTASDQCQDMIQRAFRGFAVSVYFGLALLALHLAWRLLPMACTHLWRTFFKQQQMQQMQQTRPPTTIQLVLVGNTQQGVQLRGDDLVGQGAQDAQCFREGRVHEVNLDYGAICRVQRGHHLGCDNDVQQGPQHQNADKHT